jgi:hypothetical protein
MFRLLPVNEMRGVLASLTATTDKTESIVENNDDNNNNNKNDNNNDDVTSQQPARDWKLLDNIIATKDDSPQKAMLVDAAPNVAIAQPAPSGDVKRAKRVALPARDATRLFDFERMLKPLTRESKGRRFWRRESM